jgi:alanyl-tRNA synthetase
VALQHLSEMEDNLRFVEAFFQSRGAELQKKLQQEREERKALERQLAQLKAKAAASRGDDLASSAVDVKGVKVLAARLEGADVKTLRDTLDQLKSKLKSGAIVLAAADGDNKVSLIAGVTQDLINRVKAGELVNYVATQVGGKGGGRADMAQAGGTDSKALPKALASVQEWVEQRL